MRKDYAKRNTTRTGSSRTRKSAPGSASARRSGVTGRKRSSGDTRRSGSDRRTPHKQPTSFAWSAFGTGMLVGALGTLTIAFLSPAFVSNTDQAPATVNPATAQSSDTPDGAQDPVTRFEFYDLLRQDQMPPPAKQNEPQQKDSTGENRVVYLLQAGSFRNLEDAQRLRANLLLLGLETYISEYRGERGVLWHQVRVGPFTQAIQAQRATTKLRENGIDPLPLRSAVAKPT